MPGKLHPLLAYSLGVAISVVLLAARCVASGPRRSGVVGVMVLVGVFWLGLTPLVMCWALTTLEMRCPVLSIENDASAANVLPPDRAQRAPGPSHLGMELGDVLVKRSGGQSV